MGRRTKTRERVVQLERKETTMEPVVEEEEYVVAVCDFCKQEYEDIDPDDLNAVHINPETPQREVEDTVQVPKDDDNHWKEIYQALLETPLVHHQRLPVMETKPNVSLGAHEIPDLGEYESEVKDDVVAYRFSVRVSHEQNPESVLKVCDNCKEAFEDAKNTSQDFPHS